MVLPTVMSTRREAVIVQSDENMARWYECPEARAALADRDICAVYRLLQQDGVSQREIARRTGQCQSEVSDIVQGRQVRDVTVLERIADGLGVPRELMRLAGHAEDGVGAYPGKDEDADTQEEVDEEVHRRALLATAGVSVVGRPVDKLGELLELPEPAPVPLPTRIDGIHVTQVRSLTSRLGAASNAGTAPEVLSAAAAWAEPLLSVPGPEPVKRALKVAVAELHMEAAWAGFDYWRHNRAMHHFRTALQLATEAGDTYLQAEALIQAGGAIREFGHPNDGLKLLQLGQVKAWGIPDDEPRAVVVGVIGKAAVEAVARVETANALADMGRLDAAEVEMGEARELWSATRADAFGDLDRPAARLTLRRGQLDAAEALAAASVRRWEGVSRVAHTRSSIVLATVHVRAGEPSGLPLAQGAISAAGKLGSARVHAQLAPLAAALAARPSRDAQHLYRLATAVSGHRHR